MVEAIATYIGELLYENDIVIVPALGGFVRTYKSSSIDHVQGLLYPPSNNIAFNENLVVNDGLLINKICQKQQCTQSVAKTELENFVSAVKKALRNREIVVFPGVGRIYVDYEGQVQFLPDNVNYNTDVFGLPTVQYYPILRSRESAKSDAAQPVILTEPKHQIIEQRKRWSQRLRPAVPFLIAAFVVIGGLGAYLSMDTSPFTTKEVNLPNLNLSPTKSRQPIIEESQKLDEDDVDDLQESEIKEDADWLAEEEKDLHKEIASTTETTKPNDATVVKPVIKKPIPVEEVIDTEGETLRPNQPYAVIIVHAFGSPENVRRMMQNLYEKGYSPYKDKFKSLTRVGIQLAYDTRQELDDNLTEIKNTINKGAYILEDGSIEKE